MKKNNDYYVVQKWMVDLDLTGSEVQLYAILYGFSKDENSVFFGSLNYLATWLKKSVMTIRRYLAGMEKKELIKSGKIIKDGKAYTFYQTISQNEEKNCENKKAKDCESEEAKDCESEEAKEKEKIDKNEILEKWNNALEAIKPEAKINKITKVRYTHLLARISEAGTTSFNDICCMISQASDFIKNWQNFSFDWVVKCEDNYNKLLEGKYSNKLPKSAKLSTAILAEDVFKINI